MIMATQKNTGFHIFFEAHNSQEVPKEFQTKSKLIAHLDAGYGLNPVRTKQFTEVLGDILCLSAEAVEILMHGEDSEQLKLLTLASRMSTQKHLIMHEPATTAYGQNKNWHSFVGHKRWHTRVSTIYQKDEHTGRLVNKHASISNFPGGYNHIPEKKENDHRVNYFLWSLWEGFTPKEKRIFGHLRYDDNKKSPHACQFINTLLMAQKLLANAVVAVESRDERYPDFDNDLVTLRKDYIDIVGYHLDQMFYRFRAGRLEGEPLRARIIKSAAINMAINELDGVEQVDAAARPHIPEHLTNVTKLPFDTKYSQHSANEIFQALLLDFPSFFDDKSRSISEVVFLAQKLLSKYVEERAPMDFEGNGRFNESHASIKSVGYFAALLVHDYLYNVTVPRQIMGDTTANISAFAGIKNYIDDRNALPESHWKFYFNRYAALYYGFNPNISLKEGVDSYYRVRELNRSLHQKFYQECDRLSSRSIAELVPHLTPEDLLLSSPFSMPGSKVKYRIDF